MGYSYVFINEIDLTSRMRLDCAETVPDDQLVTSTDSTPRVLLKWDEREEKPASLGSAQVYSHAEVLVELARPEWRVEAD